MVGRKHAQDVVVVSRVVVRSGAFASNRPPVATLEAQKRRAAVLYYSPLTATRARHTFFDAHCFCPLIEC